MKTMKPELRARKLPPMALSTRELNREEHDKRENDSIVREVSQWKRISPKTRDMLLDALRMKRDCAQRSVIRDIDRIRRELDDICFYVKRNASLSGRSMSVLREDLDTMVGRLNNFYGRASDQHFYFTIKEKPKRVLEQIYADMEKGDAQ